MTDERYVFQQDVKERSKIKTGAFHKENGVKSKRCTLPSDHLTPAQRRKMNGECMTINLNQKIDAIKELNKYPESMQAEYLQNLITNYGARRTDICLMLHSDCGTFKKYCERHNIILNFPFTGRGQASKMDERWLDFITAPEEKEQVEHKTDEQIIEEHFGIRLEPTVEAKPEPEVVVEPEPIKPIIADVLSGEPIGTHAIHPVSGYNAVIKMQLDLKGSKAEIMHMMDAILGQECFYIMNLKIVNADKEESA